MSNSPRSSDRSEMNLLRSGPVHIKFEISIFADCGVPDGHELQFLSHQLMPNHLRNSFERFHSYWIRFEKRVAIDSVPRSIQAKNKSIYLVRCIKSVLTYSLFGHCISNKRTSNLRQWKCFTETLYSLPRKSDLCIPIHWKILDQQGTTNI